LVEQRIEDFVALGSGPTTGVHRVEKPKLPRRALFGQEL
jgi:hypothetical protein